MRRARTPARTPARNVRRRLAYTTPRRLTPATMARLNVRPSGYSGAGRDEIKFNDQFHEQNITKDMASAMCDPTTSLNLTYLNVGTAQNQRVGRNAYIKSIYISGHVLLPTTATTNGMDNFYITMWLVQDMQTNRAQMDPTQFLTQPSSANTHADAFQNLEYSNRFKLLKKKRVHCRRTGPKDGSNFPYGAFHFQIFKKCNITQQYGDKAGSPGTTDGTIASLTTNSIHLLAIGAPGIPTNTLMRYNVRCRFTD